MFRRFTVTLFVVALCAPLGVRAASWQELVSCVPGGSSGLSGADFATLRSSAHFGGLLDLLGAARRGVSVPRDPASGMDPRGETDRGVTALYGTREELSVLKGRFDAAKIKAYYQGKLGAKFKEIAIPGAAAMSASKGQTLALIGPDRALIGSDKRVKAAVAACAKGKASNAFFKVARSSEPVWFAGNVSKKQRAAIAARDEPDMANLHAMRGWARLGEGLSAHVDLVSDSDEHAAGIERRVKQRMDQLRGRTSVKLLGLTAFLDATRVSLGGKATAVATVLAPAQTSLLLSLGPKVFSALK